PAPATALPKELLEHVNIITPNRTEASMLSGFEVTDLETAKEAAKRIHQMGVENVVITMGSLGAVVFTGKEYHLVPAHVVQTVDSTAAGDVFNGALAVSLSEGKDLLDAVRFACEAAAVSVTRLGAQSSIPYRNELIARKLIID
ncbi:MAG: ribokinase, partial [Sphingobacteriales bacterium]